MNDISKCPGTDCPQKDTCYRFTSKADLMQSWFAETPWDAGTQTCSYYWTVFNPATKKVKGKKK